MKITSHKLIIVLLAAVLLVAATPCISNAQGLQSDAFDGSGQALQPFWHVQNTFWHNQPGNTGSYTLNNGNLVVEGAFYQNIWDADYSRRFYQVTNQEQFSVETSLIFDHQDVCSIAGLIIKSPTQNEWVVLKLWGQGAEGQFGWSAHTAHLQFQRRELGIVDVSDSVRAAGNIATTMRLNRDGDTYTAWYKPDAQGEWVYVAETTVALRGAIEVGIFVGICQDEAPGGLTVTFNNFRVTTDPTELAHQAQEDAKLKDSQVTTPVIPAVTAVTAVTYAQNVSHIHVDAVNGKNEVTGRGAAGKAYKSITYALLISEKSNLPEPWHVHIHPGTYNADPAKPANEREVFPIRLRSKMLIQGMTTAADCIIDAQHLGETDTSILLGEDVGDVSIRNLTIQNMNRKGFEPPSAGGIVFWNTGGGREAASSIEGCVVHNNAQSGVSTNLTLALIGNTFSNNHLLGVKTIGASLTVLNNTFSHNREGGLGFNDPWRQSELNFVGNISENTFEGNSTGFRIYGNLTGDVTHNKFTGNDRSGFRIYQIQHGNYNQKDGSLIGNVSHNTFEGNSAGGSGGYDGGGGFAVGGELSGNVTHNTFTENKSYNGNNGGFEVSVFNGNVTHNTFVNNTAPHGGGGFAVYRKFTGKITHNLFDSNSLSGGGGGAINLELPSGQKGGHAEISNNIFINNSASSGASSVQVKVSSTFTNNLFMVSVGLSAGLIPAVRVETDMHAREDPENRFHNNIFSGMKTAIDNSTSRDLPITHNLFHNIGTNFVNQGGSGTGNDLAFWELLADGANNNIVGGLLLVDAANGDFHPVAGSPTINAGTNQYAPADDFDGTARPVGGGIDIGPYEYKQIADQTATFIPEDVNQDGRVSIADVIEVAQALGKQVSEKPRADVNGDGAISFADLVAIARALAKARSGAAAPSQKAVVLDAATVQTWLQLARIEDDGSLMFREGIANLEQLLASLLPKETILLTNYPNPFNPETWIPYRLAKPAKVSIAIHTANGQLVRVLALGTQSAGMYQHRSRAAYWDGKNEVGEPVASGVYFYTLTAGDFNATRKMLIRK